jgi:protein-L-isoaspartate O-methyltransferase
MSQSATAPPAYPLAGTATVDGPRHHGYLSELLDPVTRSRIAGLGDLTGKQVLEVGAGAGSVAVWLADQVGPTGSVLALDLDTTWLPEHPQLRGLEYDVTQPRLPEGSWDLIHSRLVLNHLGSRREVTHRLVEALNPGGYIVLEDWHGMDTQTAMWAPSRREFDLINKMQEALGANFTASGTNREWCRQVPAVLTDEGLVDVYTTINGESYAGGSVGTGMIKGNIQRVRGRLADFGVSESEIDELLVLLDNPKVIVRGHPMYTTTARKPA